MHKGNSSRSQTVTVKFRLGNKSFEFEGEARVPAGPARVDDMLPLARSISDRVVHETCAAVEEAGERISCRKGCGACCRSLVAISEIEARRVARIIENLPEPRRSEIRGRFEQASHRLAQSGLLEKLLQPEKMTFQEYNDIMSPYFRLGMPCPFLEQESCSIYEERPITCREFLVTSPAEDCARVDSKDVVRIRLPLSVFNATARWNVPAADHVNERWVPLSLAPQWAEAHPGEPPLRPGRELLEEFLGHLSLKVDQPGIE